MIYGYIRVSTDKQTVENQRFEIREFVRQEGERVDSWIEETISGCKGIEERKLGNVMKRMKKGDVLICAELSRLGRNLLMIMGLLNQCMSREIEVWTIKDNYRLGNDISSKVLAFAFGLSAEIERNLISQRTKEALARKRAEGTILGRPKGSRSKIRKLTGKESVINKLLESKVSISAIARQLKVHRWTVTAFIHDFLIKRKVEVINQAVLVDGRVFFRFGAKGPERACQSIIPAEPKQEDKRQIWLGRLRKTLNEIHKRDTEATVSQLLSVWRLIHIPDPLLNV